MSSIAPDLRLALSALWRRSSDGGVLEELSETLADRQIVPTANARAAIRAACDALCLRSGDTVLVPAYNCGSEIDALLDAGLRLLPYDQGPGLEADASHLADRIGPEVRALYVIHYFGHVQPQIAALRDLAFARGLKLIEDCALALGACSRDGPAGSFGDAAVFSLSKFFALAGGGVLALPQATSAPVFDQRGPGHPAARALARRLVQSVLGEGGMNALRRIRRRGVSVTPTMRPDMPADYYFSPALRNAAMPALSAKLLSGSSLLEAAEARRVNHETLRAALTNLPELAAKPLPPACPPNLTVLVAERDRLAAALAEEGIAVSPWWAGYHRDFDWTDQRRAAWLKDHGLALPVHQGLNTAAMMRIAEALFRHNARAAPIPQSMEAG